MRSLDQAARVLRIEGDLTLSKAEAIRKTLLNAVTAHGTIEIDCADATNIDVSFIQLLLAARRSAASRGKSLSLASPASGALLNALERGGFLTAIGSRSAADRQFWGRETPNA